MPSRGTPLGPLFLFSSCFFSRGVEALLKRLFSCFLFVHLFSFFDHFFISLIFLMFFHFFFFSCLSFKCVLLLALVSEFNCFLRSRCSMEMWCPDDIGRDRWDWIGPPTWDESMIQLPRVGWRLLACENGASSRLLLLLW